MQNKYRYINIIALTIFLLVNTPSFNHACDMEIQRLQMENTAHKNMFHNLIDGLFEHCGHWRELNAAAKKHWGDPNSPILKGKVDEQVASIKNTLIAAIPHNKKAVDIYLTEYFIRQYEYLWKDFKNTPNTSKTPFSSQYLATLTYETKAAEMGLYMEDHYHKFYNQIEYLSPSKEQFIEDLNLKNKNILPVFKPPAPPPFPPQIKPLTKPKPLASPPKQIKIEPSHNQNQLLEEIRKGDYKLKSVNLDHIPPPLKDAKNQLLDEIRNKQYKLKSVTTEMLKPPLKPEDSSANSLADILRKKFQNMRLNIQTTPENEGDEEDDTTWK